MCQLRWSKLEFSAEKGFAISSTAGLGSASAVSQKPHEKIVLLLEFIASCKDVCPKTGCQQKRECCCTGLTGGGQVEMGDIVTI